MKFVNYIFADNEKPLPPVGDGYLYEYVAGANGVFVRAQRPGLEAMIWVASTPQPVRGLVELSPYVSMDQRVRAVQVGRMFEMAYRAGGKEILFYMWPDIGFTTLNDDWKLMLPDQEQSGASVHPVDPFAGGTKTAIEVHSHHNMPAFFSPTDDREEHTGFRIYAVMGDLGRYPSMLVRVGIYGHFMNIPAQWVFDLPLGVRDALYEEQEEEIRYVDAID